MNQSSEEFWQVMRPGCGHINYFRFVRRNMHHTEAPIVKCRCGKYFSLLEAAVFRAGLCERVVPLPLVQRQAVTVEFINPHAIES